MTASPAIPDYSGPSAAIIPGSLYIAERPGGGGRSQRVPRRHADLAAASGAGVRVIVSCLTSRHALSEYARHGFSTRWHPLTDIHMATHGGRLRDLADEVALALTRGPGAILIHVDRWGEWTAAVAAVLRVRLGLASSWEEALEQGESDGLPAGEMARALRPDGIPAAPEIPEDIPAPYMGTPAVPNPSGVGVGGHLIAASLPDRDGWRVVLFLLPGGSARRWAVWSARPTDGACFDGDYFAEYGDACAAFEERNARTTH